MKKPVEPKRRVLPTLIGSEEVLQTALMGLYGELQWISENPTQMFRVDILLGDVLVWAGECEGYSIREDELDRPTSLEHETSGAVPAGEDPQWESWRRQAVKDSTRPSSSSRPSGRRKRRR